MYYLELVLSKNVLLITSYFLLSSISILQECNTYYFFLITCY